MWPSELPTQRDSQPDRETPRAEHHEPVPDPVLPTAAAPDPLQRDDLVTLVSSAVSSKLGP